MNIKEIEERSGLTRANIRYYEQEGLLAPARRENKYRDYSEEDLETLLRIALLRNLGFSLDEIRRLQSGELELAAAMRERSAALESEGQRLLAARNVCDAISREVTSYSALRPEDYLNGFEPDAAAKQRDVAEPHPWRRYFARGIDLVLVGLPVSFVQYVLLHRNYTTVSRWEDIICALIGIVWGIDIVRSDETPNVVAGHVLAGIGLVCASLVALVASVVRQIQNTYSEADRRFWPWLVIVMGTIDILWGLYLLIFQYGPVTIAPGFVLIGLGIVCYSILSKVLLLALVWRHPYPLAKRIPLIPVLTALTCLFIAAFLFEAATINPAYMVPARVMVGLGGICFTLFSIVSILESGTSS